MTHWILILTLYSGVYSGGAPTITAIPGFSSSDACIAAGNAWLQHINTQRDNFRYFFPNATCVKDG